jgi:hypothetical protein
MQAYTEAKHNGSPNFQPRPPQAAASAPAHVFVTDRETRKIKRHHQLLQHVVNRMLSRIGIPDKATRAAVGIHGLLNGREVLGTPAKFPVLMSHKFAARQMGFNGQDANCDQFMCRVLTALAEAEQKCGRKLFEIRRADGITQIITSYEADFLGEAALWALDQAMQSQEWNSCPAKAVTDELIDAALEKLPRCAPSPDSGGDGGNVENVIKAIFTKMMDAGEKNIDRIIEAGGDPRRDIARFCGTLQKTAESKFFQHRMTEERERHKQEEELLYNDPRFHIDLGDAEGGGNGQNIDAPFDTPPEETEEDAPPVSLTPPPEEKANENAAPDEDAAPDMEKWALAYAKAGRAVTPLHTPDAAGKCSCRKANCASVGKHPRTLNGVKDATTNPDTISRWWGMWPESNIGIATGEASGFDCLDVDPRAGGDVALTELIEKHGDLPKTCTVRTGGGGYHLLFAHSGIQFKNSASDIGEGLDIKTTGGYIVAAPSLHVSGKRYEWTDTIAPADWPTWMLEELTKPKPKREGKGCEKLKAFVFTAEGPPITEGKRNKKLFGICSRMRGDGMNQEQIERAALEINAARCQPPMDDEEVLGIAESVMRYDPNVIESEVVQ